MTPIDPSDTKAGWRCWWPFALLCVIAASRWMSLDALPEMGSTLRTEALGCGIAGLIAVALAAAARGPVELRPQNWLRLPAIGAGLLAAPALGAALRGAAGNSLNRTVALCLVPVVVVVWDGVRANPEARSTIWPGLTGLAAALLLFPVAAPAEVWGYAGLLVPPIAVSSAIVFVRRADLEAWGAAMVLAGGAAGLALIECGRMLSDPGFSQPTHWPGVLVDVVMAWLGIRSVRDLNLQRYASRYFVVPVLTILEGAVMLREKGNLRMWAGIALMFVASVNLWRRPPVDEERLRLS